MNKKEAFELLSKTEDIFKSNDIFSQVSNVQDPIKMFNREDDTKADSKSSKFQLEFIYNTYVYILIYEGTLKLFKADGTEQLTYVADIETFKDIIDTLEKDDTENGKSE
ncbi:hypothetical protein [Staphylococcus phage SAPYZU_15]|nr:hypothetical protein [Staphylococcus phage SAPYZU_15]